MKKLKQFYDKIPYKNWVLGILVVVVVTIYVELRKPRTLKEFQAQPHEITKGIIYREKSVKGARSLVYKFEYFWVEFEGSIPKKGSMAQVGDSCTVIFLVKKPSTNLMLGFERNESD